jgi:cytochrome c-type biogenesis protein CcmE
MIAIAEASDNEKAQLLRTVAGSTSSLASQHHRFSMELIKNEEENERAAIYAELAVLPNALRDDAYIEEMKSLSEATSNENARELLVKIIERYTPPPAVNSVTYDQALAIASKLPPGTELDRDTFTTRKRKRRK